MDLFFYGTLRHLPLLKTVLAEGFDRVTLTDASLPNHQARAIAGQDFPMIVEMDGQAEGLLCQGLSEDDVARLNYYEGGFNYELRDVLVETNTGAQPAQVYFPIEPHWGDNGPWDFPKWVAKNAALTDQAAPEVMSYFGVITAAQLEFMFPMIRARAAQQLAAAQEDRPLGPSGYSRADTQDNGAEITHKGFFIMKTADVAFRQYDGEMSASVKREVFVGSEASIVLPYDSVRDRVLLVEQFRAGPYVRGDKAPWMLEPIAGRVDAGETPEDAAHREGFEEANIRFKKLHPIAKCYASPGCNTEYFNIFLGECDLPDDIVGINGLDSEAEDIKSYLYSFDALMEMTESFQAANAPLVLAALWLAQNRKRLHSV